MDKGQGKFASAVGKLDANSVVGIILLLLAAVALGLVIWQSITRDLTGLESTLFASLTFVLSTAGSFIVSAFLNQRQARREYEQLAKPSLRRVDSLVSAVTQIETVVGSRIASVSSGNDEGVETQKVWLEGLQSNLVLLRTQVEDATTDWRELLPEEYEDALRRATTVQKEFRDNVNRLEGELANARKAAAQGDHEAKQRIKALELDLKEAKTSQLAAEKKIESFNRTINNFGIYGSSNPLLTAGSTLSDVAGRISADQIRVTGSLGTGPE
ncbi:hypothetical protein [Glutamicibacter nicotianae]|uniref:hypothetical protein n=1 Tax=Glutamicibacter nicotianae TaxID=37929 RepID=UPI0013CED1DD|nr:hypothetical protein [Glutamicibacter nicotianae]